MRLFVVAVVNGAARVVSEWNNNEKGALVSFHDTCKTLWNASDVITATIKILDENLNCYAEKYESIDRTQTSDPTE